MAFLPDFGRLLLLAAVFVPLERLFALHSAQRILRRQWLNDVIYFALNGSIIGIGTTLLAISTILAAEALVPAPIQQAVAGQPFWLQTLEVILLADLGFYVAHLAFHKIPFLWKVHAVHHSIEELDWLAAHRVHPVDQILTKSISLLPIFAAGFSTEAITTFAVIYGWHSILLHANVRLDIGPLRWLVASPQFHHWHHANQPEAFDKNFAGQLAFLDVIFRTAYLPRGSGPVRYGTDDPVPDSYLRQLIYPFRPAARRDDAAGAGVGHATGDEAVGSGAVRSA